MTDQMRNKGVEFWVCVCVWGKRIHRLSRESTFYFPSKTQVKLVHTLVLLQR